MQLLRDNLVCNPSWDNEPAYADSLLQTLWTSSEAEPPAAAQAEAAQPEEPKQDAAPEEPKAEA